MPMTNQPLNRCIICQRIWPRSGGAKCPHCGAADTIESYYEPDQATTAVPPRPSRSSRVFDEREDLRLRSAGPTQSWVLWLALVGVLCLFGLATVAGMVFWATLRAAPNPLPPPPPVAVAQDNPMQDAPAAPDLLPAPDAERDLLIDREHLPAPDVERLPGRADLVGD